jgi:hypothetical protein
MSAPIFRSELFETSGGADFILAVRIIKKSGEPWLILPQERELAVQGLSLYPAQTAFAKRARQMVGIALRLGLPMKSERAEMQFSREDSFVRFLQGLTPGGEKSFPSFAMLAGNPKATGRRFILLLFFHGKPVCVVKAGVGPEAQELVQRENLFFRAVPHGAPGLPKARSSFASSRVKALAMDYVAGDSPAVDACQEIGILLSAWVNREKRVQLEEIRAWQRLSKEQSGDPIFLKLNSAFKDTKFCATLFHGDFAPWNIKVANGTWTALDWERGEAVGFPGWDWFHYVAQSAILVEKLSAEAVAQKLEKLLASESFKKYAATAGISGQEKVLTVAYLFYCAKILRPTEGAEVGEKMLSVLSERWLK